jgi:hypothetical protein
VSMVLGYCDAMKLGRMEIVHLAVI